MAACKECMCHLQNIATCDWHPESVTTGQIDTQIYGETDPRQSDPYVPLCFAGDA